MVEAPGVYDVFTAKVAERMGFDVVYVGSSLIAASTYGLPDIGIVKAPEQVHGGPRTTDPEGASQAEPDPQGGRETVRRARVRQGSIHDIGVAAGVTGPAIYRDFPSKEALLVSAFEHLYRRAADGFAAVLAEPLDDRTALERLIDFEIRLVTEEPEKIRIANSEVRHLPAESAAELHAQTRRHLKF